MDITSKMIWRSMGEIEDIDNWTYGTMHNLDVMFDIVREMQSDIATIKEMLCKEDKNKKDIINLLSQQNENSDNHTSVSVDKVDENKDSVCEQY